jgi:hypothetical protein
MNKLGKVLDVVLARRIHYMAEKHSILPESHTGRQKLTLCKHAVHLLLLDVSGAFENVSHDDMRDSFTTCKSSASILRLPSELLAFSKADKPRSG